VSSRQLTHALDAFSARPVARCSNTRRRQTVRAV
jgi:hypothetical protein